jgi:hypothetical protein
MFEHVPKIAAGPSRRARPWRMHSCWPRSRRSLDISCLGSTALRSAPPRAPRLCRRSSAAEGAFGDTPACTPCSIGFLIAAATSCARSGDVDRARSYVERAAGVASMWGESAWTAGVAEAEPRFSSQGRSRGAPLLRGCGSLRTRRAAARRGALPRPRGRDRLEEVPRKKRGRTAP